MGSPDDRCKNDHTQRPEPVRLVVSRRNREIQKRAFLVPHPAVVGRGDSKSVVARREISVKRLAAISYVVPIAIQTLEFIAEAIFLWRDKTQCGVVNF